MWVLSNWRELEKKVVVWLNGEIIQDASIMAYLDGQLLGYCMMVEVNCWGYDKMPWVFDICVKPEFHGRGIGRAIMQESINRLLDHNYPLLGLAVTLSNPAVHLYENMGFQYVDTFHEFILPTEKQ